MCIHRQENTAEKKATLNGERFSIPALKDGGMQLTARTNPRIKVSLIVIAINSSGGSSEEKLLYRQYTPKKIMIRAPNRLAYSRMLPEIKLAA